MISDIAFQRNTHHSKIFEVNNENNISVTDRIFVFIYLKNISKYSLFAMLPVVYEGNQLSRRLNGRCHISCSSLLLCTRTKKGTLQENIAKLSEKHTYEMRP